MTLGFTVACEIHRVLLIAALSASLISVSGPATAFDVRTHAVMTSEATAMSVIGRDPNASSILWRLGIIDYPVGFAARFPTFGEGYVDLGTIPILRGVKVIEADILDSVRKAYPATQIVPHQLTLTGWIMRGAIREDDNREETPTGIGDEPDGVFNRVFGHFFDPQVGPLGRGLTVAGVPLGARAVDWALQPGATVTNLPASFGNRENHFKIQDAREAMWRALTLRTATMGAGVYPEGWSADAPGRESLRKAYWATAFRALGDVVHLVQDMGQPQHTRNDAHSGIGCIPSAGCLGGHDSFFEKHLRARSSKETRINIKEGLLGPDIVSRIDVEPTNLVYTGYAKPLFNMYSDFFATGVNGGNVAGKGLANYSNRGFYSFATNIGSAGAAQYPNPNPTGSGLAYTIISEPELKDSANRLLTGSVVFRTGAVADTVTNTPEPNVKLAAVGAWDQFLQQKNATWGSYTLNYYNYDDQARLLVPRAVAYSAGLIDYFFRGQMYVAPPAESVFALVDHGDPASNCKDTCGFSRVKLKVANATPDITPPGGTATAQAMGTGVLVAVAKFRRSTCYTADLAGEYQDGGSEARPAYYDRCTNGQAEEIVVSDPVSVSGIPACGSNCDAAAVPYTFNFQSPIPINAASIALQVVFRGGLGSEADAVVVQTVDVSEPTYFIYMNASDYIKIGDKLYTRDRINNEPNPPDGRPSASALRQAVRPQTCIVNDQLIESCFPPYSVSFPLQWGSPATSTVTAPLALTQPRTYSRFAMLVPPLLSGTIAQSASPCSPHDPMVFSGKQLQEQVIPDPNQVPQPGEPINYVRNIAISSMKSVRGVGAYAGVACVALGDEMVSLAPESEILRMAPVTGAELVAKPIAGFSFGP